ncbi:MAG: hypothetical protein EA409_06845 [Saprospirales bacterium]|nr:MAG: hypothetical protein EA409_06845 [Saprospirales bacterium]
MNLLQICGQRRHRDLAHGVVIQVVNSMMPCVAVILEFTLPETLKKLRFVKLGTIILLMKKDASLILLKTLVVNIIGGVRRNHY